MHFRRRMRHRIQPVRHRVSRRALRLASVMAAELRRGETGETTNKNGKSERPRKRKAYAPVTWSYVEGHMRGAPKWYLSPTSHYEIIDITEKCLESGNQSTY